jgi:hypothetical protein
MAEISPRVATVFATVTPPTKPHRVECKMRNIMNAKLARIREEKIIEYLRTIYHTFGRDSG